MDILEGSEAATEAAIAALAALLQAKSELQGAPSVEEAAADCPLFNRGNCFQFPAAHVLRSKPGPAYMRLFEDDVKRDQHEHVRVETRHVRLVYISFPDTAAPIRCLMDEATGILYDEVFEYPWGRAKLDPKTGEPIQVDIDTYLGDCRARVR